MCIGTKSKSKQSTNANANKTNGTVLKQKNWAKGPFKYYVTLKGVGGGGPKCHGNFFCFLAQILMFLEAKKLCLIARYDFKEKYPI